MPDRDLALLDACSLIGLYATRRIEATRASNPNRFCIVDVVRQETGYVLRGGDGADANDREPIDIAPLEETGLLTTLAAAEEHEFRTYIELRREMGNGEAMTGAVAIHRGFKVITDDRKALRILNQHGVRCETTLDLIKFWGERNDASRDELRAVLLDVRQRARQEPHRQHHLRDWWNTSISG